MKNKKTPLLISLVILFAAFLLSIIIGSVAIPFDMVFKILGAWVQQNSELLDRLQPFPAILILIRLPRTILMMASGAALAGSGAAYQGLFRNPLADPYLIGVASGAGLGAVLAMMLKTYQSGTLVYFVPFSALIFALLTVFIVYQIAHIGQTVPTTNLILAGVAVSSLLTALTSFFMINSSGELRQALVWLLGGASTSGWQPVFAITPYILAGICIMILMGHSLNVLQFGDEQAKQLGLRVNRVRKVVVVGATLSAAAAVSFVGIIGFVGLIVPHLVRILWGNDYKRLIPLAIINGASLLIVADILARTIMAPQVLPVGIITSLAGAPFFLWVLRRAKQENYW